MAENEQQPVPDQPSAPEPVSEPTPGVLEPLAPQDPNIPTPQQHPKTEAGTPASAVEGGRETSNKILYVGGLHKSVSEEMLKDLFASAGVIHSVKILNDKNKPGFNYAFIEFETTAAADMALHTLNGRILNNLEIKLNWAYQSLTINSSNLPDEPAFNIFVGDLLPEVDDELLSKAFSRFSSLKQAHVMWDMQTLRSRGYGFVTFGIQADAELALQTMNGEWVNGRAIRCNWASHKQPGPTNGPFRNGRPNNGRQYRQYPTNGHPLGQMPVPGPNGHYQQQAPLQPPGPPQGPSNIPVMLPQSYDIVLRQTPSWQTTVYLGNIAHFTQQTDLIPLLQNFGFIVDFKFHPERGCAFVKYDSHERAALAIVQLAGFTVNGRPLKCGWGKDRPPMGQYQNFGRPQQYAQGRS